MTKKITKVTTTPESGEMKQKLTIQQVKKLLSKKNTAPKLEIIQGPMSCMLGIALFDQSPEAQSISGLGFTIGAEIQKEKIALHYCVQLYKPTVSIEDKYIVVSGKIIKVPEDKGSEIEKEKFTFLPEGTEVRVKYDQDAGMGELEILSYPLDLHENTTKTINTSLENFKGKTNVVSTLIGELNDNFDKLQKLQNETSKEGKDKQIGETRAKLVESINFLRTIQNEEFKENAYQAIKDSKEHQQIKDYKKEVEIKNQEKEEIEKGFNDLQKVNVEKLRKYIKQQNTHISKIQKILENEIEIEQKKTNDLKLALTKACSIGLFAVADNFIAQDHSAHTYRKIQHDKEPEYVKGKLNIEEVHKIIKLLTDIQEKYPDLLQQIGVVDQIKNSINTWRSKVEENVKNGIYNPFTRSDAIRYEHLRNMLGQICGNDGSVLNDMIAIFDALLEQKHPDGTNSSSFIHEVQNGISTYLQATKNSPNQDKDGEILKSLIDVKTIKYIDKELAKEVGLFDIDSKFWMETLISAIQDPEIEKQSLALLGQQSKNITSSVFPDAEIHEYISFLKKFFKTKKYMIGNQSGSIDKNTIIKEIQDIYTGVLSHKVAEKQRKENIIIKAKERAKEVFKQLTSQQRKEYFKKVYDKSRGQNHNTGIHTYQEFDDASIVTVISEHSYRGSRGGTEVESQLCLYVNDCTQTSSTGYQNYRDRFDSKNDNYNNQYVEVLEVKNEGEKYFIQVKTGTGSIRALEMSPERTYQLNMNILAELSGLLVEDKNLFLDAIKFQKDVDKTK